MKTMIPLTIFSQRTYTIAAASVALVVLSAALLYQVQTPIARALGYGATVSASPNTVYLSGNAAAASTTTETPIREVHIANNGLVLLRGAHVLSVSGSVIRVGMMWGSSEFKWIVQTDYSTKFLNTGGEKVSETDIHIGDIVTVTGTILRNGSEPVVDADVVRK